MKYVHNDHSKRILDTITKFHKDLHLMPPTSNVPCNTSIYLFSMTML